MAMVVITLALESIHLGSIYDFKATSFNDDPDRSYNIEFDALCKS